MAKVVIIGNSAAGFAACDTLIRNAPELDIVVISGETYLAYRRSLLLDYLSGGVAENDLFLCDGDFYKRNNIIFLQNYEVTRLETKKQRVVFKDTSKLDYDYLIIASGQRVNIPDIPGKTKDGVFSLYNLEEAKKIKQLLAIIPLICLVGESQLCLSFLEKFAVKDKEAKIISKPRPESFVSTEKIEWIDNCQISELIGEGAELKALKLDSGKVIGTSFVLFLGNYVASSDFLKETEINNSGGYIIVDDNMRTNVGNVFACGSVCAKEGVSKNKKSWQEAASEGGLAAYSLIQLIERGK